MVLGWCEKGQHFVRRTFKDYIEHGICAEHPDQRTKELRQRIPEYDTHLI
jgi:hypothetical protein